VRTGPLALLAAVLAAPPAPARAAVMRPATVEQLARSADAVVRGRVERSTSRWSADGRRIVTEAEVSVAATWRGGAPARLRVVVPGGTVGDVAQTTAGAPLLAGGEEVVLFLARRGEAWRVNGLALGKYRVEGAAARPDLSGIAFAPGAVPAGERLPAEMPVAELERRVRAAR
jgi:hypothetical protein